MLGSGRGCNIGGGCIAEHQHFVVPQCAFSNLLEHLAHGVLIRRCFVSAILLLGLHFGHLRGWRGRLLEGWRLHPNEGRREVTRDRGTRWLERRQNNVPGKQSWRPAELNEVCDPPRQNGVCRAHIADWVSGSGTVPFPCVSRSVPVAPSSFELKPRMCLCQMQFRRYQLPAGTLVSGPLESCLMCCNVHQLGTNCSHGHHGRGSNSHKLPASISNCILRMPVGFARFVVSRCSPHYCC